MASTLPRWNLTTDLYKSPTAKQIETDMRAYEEWSEKFAKKYKGKLEDLTPRQWVKAIDEYHSQIDLITKVYNYPYLLYSMNISNSDYNNLFVDTSKRYIAANTKTMFFYNGLAKLNKEKYDTLVKSEDISEKYRYFIEYARASMMFTLDEAAEKALQEVSELTSGWYQYWEKQDAAMKFKLNEREYTHVQIRDIINNSTDEEKRKAAFEVYADAYKHLVVGFTHSLNMVFRSIEISKDQRGYGRYETEWNIMNEIYDDNIMDRMARSINNSRIEEKFYKLKAKMMGKDNLEPWDIQAPLSDDPYGTIPWKKAKEMVVAAYDHFDPRLGAIAKKAFSEGWVDAQPRAGKWSGNGFCLPGSKASHPHILVNYRGSFGDLTTLAHEMGHLIAMHVATEAQGNCLKDTNYLIAEVTATFGEELLFREFERRTKTDFERRHLLVKKLENSMYSLARSHEYEFAKICQKGHAEEGEFLTKHFSKKYVEKMKEAYGSAVKSMDKSGFMWMTKGHLFSNPYYLGDYPATNLIVHNLFHQADAGKIPDFRDKWYEMLQKGGTDYTGHLLKKFGLNIESELFWDRGLERINAMIEQVKTLLKEEHKQAAWAEKTEPKQYRRAVGGRGA